MKTYWNKVVAFWDNATIFWELAMEYKRSALAILIAVVLLGFAAYSRLPPATSCAWKAMVVQSVPYEKWRFNVLPSKWNDQCQYFNGTRWIPLEKVMDVGAGEMEELELN
ncbi:hypothetical protein VPHD479_0041 [Vibrio phage D479]